jgi:hypothetical protein
MTRALFAVLLAACTALACSNNSGGETINVNGLDCGLVRADMVGKWTVTFTSGMRTMANCGGTNAAAQEGQAFAVLAGAANYTVSDAAVSQQGVGFTATGTGPNNLSNELIVSISADSCLAFVQAWQANTGGSPGWPVCVGTADRVNRLVNAVCDSVQLDTNGDNQSDTNCNLNASLSAAVGLP